jgi:hypothetical protein
MKTKLDHKGKYLMTHDCLEEQNAVEDEPQSGRPVKEAKMKQRVWHMMKSD